MIILTVKMGLKSLVFVIFYLTFSVGYGQPSVPCRCAPNRFRVNSKTLGSIMYPYTGSNSELRAFDYTLMKSVYIQNATDGYEMETMIINDYKKKIQWYIDPFFEYCNWHPLMDRMEKCLPDNAEYTDSFKIGNQKLYGDEWTISIKSESGLLSSWKKVAFLRAQNACIPFSEAFYGGPSQLETSFYVNYEDGIFVPDSLFEIPWFCEEAHMQTKRKPKMVKSRKDDNLRSPRQRQAMSARFFK